MQLAQFSENSNEIVEMMIVIVRTYTTSYVLHIYTQFTLHTVAVQAAIN